jgi:hypothetical protein
MSAPIAAGLLHVGNTRPARSFLSCGVPVAPALCRDCTNPATVLCPVCQRWLCDAHNKLGICRSSGSHRGYGANGEVGK